MARKDLAAFYGRVALVMVVFGFIAAIVAAPLLSTTSVRPSLTAAQDSAPSLELIRVKSNSHPGKQS
ncbi:MAG TPA: hypothetical protein VEZ24_18325 [Microvirga sp.]|nr:hypothetical protein [Microvirga sp.]